MRYLALALAGVAASVLAAPALATACSLTDITPTATACSGGYVGNVLDNSPPDVVTQQAALAALGFIWDGTNFSGFPKLSGLGGATTIDFPGLLNGTTIFGIHVGGSGGGQTTFYKFNAGTDLDAFTLNLARSSDAVLYTTGDPGSVPEPISWALMLGGFGTIGGLMRSRGKATVDFG